MINRMTERITVSLPKKTMSFVNDYKRKHALKSTSQVILKALEIEKEALFDMFTEMGKEVKEESVTASEREAEAFLDESW